MRVVVCGYAQPEVDGRVNQRQGDDQQSGRWLVGVSGEWLGLSRVYINQPLPLDITNEGHGKVREIAQRTCGIVCIVELYFTEYTIIRGN